MEDTKQPPHEAGAGSEAFGGATQADDTERKTKNHARQITLSRFENCRSTNAFHKSLTLAELAEKLQPSGTTKDGTAICGAVFDPPVRKLANVQAVHALILDIDDAEGTIATLTLPLADYECILWTTWSHTDEHKPKFRLLLPLARPVNVEEFDAIWRHIDKLLGGIVDQNAKDASRLQYLPRETGLSGQAARVIHHTPPARVSKGWLDPDDLPGGVSVAELVQAKEERSRAKADRSSPTDENESDGGFDRDDSAPMPDLGTEWIEDALDSLDPGALAYREWLNVVMALQRAGVPMSVADGWSRRGAKYSDDEIAKRWDSFGPGGPGRVGPRTLWHLALAHGWKPLDLVLRLAQKDVGAPFEPWALRAARCAPAAERERYIAALKGISGVSITALRDALRAFKADSTPIDTGGKALVLVDTDQDLELAEIDAAMAGDPGLFQRGGILAQIGADGQADAVPLARVRELLSRRIVFAEESDHGQRKIGPPERLCSGYHVRDRWSLRELRGIARGPIWRGDGSILHAAGYDEQTGLYLADGVDLEVPDEPTREDAQAAYQALQAPLQHFPFVAECDRAAAVALLLEIVSRHAINGSSPLYFVAADVRGAGKGLLLDVLYEIATGGTAPKDPAPRDDGELGKMITSAVIGGSAAIILDNVRGRLGGPALEAAVTASVWSDRILGESRKIALPLRVTWCATGNGANLTPDMVRRTLPIRLRAGMARPEDRDGLPDVLAHVRQHRARYLTAAFTILRAYHLSEQEQELGPWGSFEAWSRSIRAPLVWAGVEDPIGTRDRLEETADTETIALRALLVAWREDGREYFSGDLAEKMADRYETGGLARALRELIWKPNPSAEAVSHALSCYLDRPVEVDGETLRLAGPIDKNRKSRLWSVTTSAATSANDGADSVRGSDDSAEVAEVAEVSLGGSQKKKSSDPESFFSESPGRDQHTTSATSAKQPDPLTVPGRPPAEVADGNLRKPPQDRHTVRVYCRDPDCDEYEDIAAGELPGRCFDHLHLGEMVRSKVPF